jgi:membrane associated rhomboid family serine protease
MLEQDHDGFHLTRDHFLESIRFPLMAVAMLWLVHIYQTFDGFDPGAYGIMSRRLWGIRGIVTGPLVHGSWGHLFSNSVPLFVLTFICVYFYRKVAIRAFWLIYFATGISVWFFARPVSHIGASGVVYGLVSFIFWNGIFRRSLRSIILAALVLLLYSGMFMGVLPDQEGISWESHLLGSIVGVFAAYVFKSEMEDEEAAETKTPFADEADQEKIPFLPADIFEKTKAQRAWEAEEEARRRAENLYPPFWQQDGTW